MSSNTDAIPRKNLPLTLSKATWERLLRLGKLEKFTRGDIVEKQGEATNYLTIVVSGSVRMTLRLNDTDDIIGIVKLPGETISNASFHLNALKLLGANAEQDDTEVVKINRKNVYQLLSEDRKFMEFLFTDVSAQLITAFVYLLEERQLPAWLRVARRIHEFSLQNNEIDVTQTELAKQLGITRLTVAKTYGRLEAAGLVKKNYGRILVTDRDKLESWIREQADNKF